MSSEQDIVTVTTAISEECAFKTSKYGTAPKWNYFLENLQGDPASNADVSYN